MKKIFLSALLAVITSCVSLPWKSSGRSPSSLADEQLQKIQWEHEDRLQKEMKVNHWNWPQFYGSQYSSFALILARMSGHRVSWDSKTFGESLWREQLADGSWKKNIDIAPVEGDLDATILNYWALRVLGASPDDVRLKQAVVFIQSKGGVNASTTLLRHVLAVAGMVDWKKLPTMSRALYKEWPRGLSERFAVWNRLYFQTFYILQRLKPRIGPASLFIDELAMATEKSTSAPTVPKEVSDDLKQLVKLQAESGFWEGHAQGSLLISLCLQAAMNIDESYRGLWEPAHRRVFAKLEQLEAQSRLPFQGTMMEGEIWDTAYTLRAISVTNFPQEKALAAVDWLLSKQNKNGSFSYSEDFKPNPDVDTTAEVVKSLLQFRREWRVREGEIEASVNRALEWIKTRQNSDGGFAAWSVGQKKTVVLGNAIDLMMKLQKINPGVRDGLYDVSLPHITAHVIEAVVAAGKRDVYESMIQKGKAFLIESAEKDGVYFSWRGRWEVNYFWATTAVIEAFKDLKDPALELYIQGATNWILSKQNNADGGWGEAAHSYIDSRWKGRGLRSSATQTAWVVKALMRVLPMEDIRIQRGFSYLQSSYSTEQWADPLMISAVLPGEIYMDFPVYSKTSALHAIKIKLSK